MLLILAGVAINFALGDNGILRGAETAVDKYQNKAEQEQNELAKIDDYISTNREISQDQYNELKKEIEQLKKQKTISQEEHYTGEYYYNGKPIYSKTIYLSSLPNTTSVTYNHGIANVEDIWVDLQNSFVLIAEKVYPLSYLNLTDVRSHNDISSVDANSFIISTNYDRTTSTALITFRYTKTTDESNGKTLIPLN